MVGDVEIDWKKLKEPVKIAGNESLRTQKWGHRKDLAIWNEEIWEATSKKGSLFKMAESKRYRALHNL